MPRKASPTLQPIALRIELAHVEPMVWRRIVVPNQWTLASLHNYLQWVFGWQDTHAHEFHVEQDIIAPAWWLAEMADAGSPAGTDERRVSVAKVAAELGIGGIFEYHYDMGDGWVHRLVIENPPQAWMAHDLPMPACTAGQNACPPDDVGGPPGYAHLLERIAKPKHKEHAAMLHWIGGVFDPTGFDLNRVNFGWRSAKRPRSSGRSRAGD